MYKRLTSIVTSGKTWLLIFIITFLVVLNLQFDVKRQVLYLFDQQIEPWVNRRPVLGPVSFMVVYVVLVICFVPGSIPSLFGGALFGPVLGTLWVSIASSTAAAIGFLLGRYFFREWIESVAGERLNRIQRGIKEQDWKFVGFTRLVPIFPYNLLNYTFGLTRIGFWKHLLVTWICMIPATAMFVYFGWAGKELATSQKQEIKTYVFLISIGIALVLLFWMIKNWVQSTDVAESADQDAEEKE